MLITPKDISKKAERVFHDFLVKRARGASFFPLEIAFGKVKPAWAKDHFHDLHLALQALRKESKAHRGKGYTVTWQKVANRSIGESEFPARISIDTEIDYISIISAQKRTQAGAFYESFLLIKKQLPLLCDWALDHPKKVYDHAEMWEDLLKVCQYFLQSHTANSYYIRELPIAIHTKFIEQHKGIIDELLRYTLLPEKINEQYSGNSEHTFEKRYGLLYDESLIRYRLLDAEAESISDFSVRYSDFTRIPVACGTVLITENKMNFLTLPKMKNTLAIWGKGFKVNLFENAHWMKGKRIIYWGDIDTHGFWILAQLRRHFPQAESFLMDRHTFDSFYDGQKGKPINNVDVSNLTKEESLLFEYLLQGNRRLEQEKITQHYLNSALMRLGMVD